MSDSILDVAILGAGPGGLSAAARAAQRRLSHVLLEASDKHANTIQRYQRLKHVMSEPGLLPLRSDIQFAAGTREEVLETWEKGIAEKGVRIRYGSEVTSISGSGGVFEVQFRKGQPIRAKSIILALGVQGNPRKLGVPGDSLPFVTNTLESADEHRNETIVIVGAGDSAIEDAMALSRQNRVVMVNRGTEFAKAKEANSAQILKAIKNGLVDCVYQGAIKQLEPGTPGTPPARVTIASPNGAQIVACHKVITRLGAIPSRNFVESMGVRFVSPEPDALPELSAKFETTVPGVFIIGALAGYPLIKQAMNQGYEVIEHLLGNAVEPADHGVLQKKLAALRVAGGRVGVDQALAAIQQRVRVFRDVKPLGLRELAIVSRIVGPKQGTRLFNRGDYATSIYNILDGEVHLYADSVRLMTLRRGQVLGEMSLISGRPADVTAVAGARCVLFESPTPRFASSCEPSRPCRTISTERTSCARCVCSCSPHAAPETVHKLALTANIHRVAAGEKLFSEGDPVDRLYILRSGSMTLSRAAGERDVIVSYCAAGKFVDLVGQQSGALARTVTAKATVASEAISVDYKSFYSLMAGDRQLRGGSAARVQTGARRIHQDAGLARVEPAPVVPVQARPRRSDQRARDRRVAVRRLRSVRDGVRVDATSVSCRDSIARPVRRSFLCTCRPRAAIASTLTA